MRSFATHVRHSTFLLALLAPGAAADAQVAIQVRNGKLWVSSLEVKNLDLLTFRWRWDGAQTPTAVAWQVATQTPTSTATTRASDAIASETPMRLTATHGVYQEFTVTPARSWPSKFYIRMRVHLGKTSVYSRWITIGVSQRDDVATNPTCTIKAYKVSTVPTSLPIGQGEVVDGAYWTSQLIYFVFLNRLSSAVEYRRSVRFSNDGTPYQAAELSQFVADETYGDYAEAAVIVNSSVLRTLAPGKTDTVKLRVEKKILLGKPTGLLAFSARVYPTSGNGGSCSFSFTVNK